MGWTSRSLPKPLPKPRPGPLDSPQRSANRFSDERPRAEECELGSQLDFEATLYWSGRVVEGIREGT
jgi:hypothetical protein